MPTTSNFGWTTPADTDLVKDGALAIRTLGNGIDTSLVDLKGGTTDQVLAKNSNTDMDFKWVTSDDANAIQNAIVDAKGDLISATAADTPARLAVGANGTVLTADSAEATGLKWVAPAAPSFVGCRAFSSSAQTLTTGVETAITLNDETFDTNGFHSTVTNNSRITIPSGKGGYYQITGLLSYNGNSSGQRDFYIRLNGTTVIANAVISGQGSTVIGQSICDLRNLSAGDYIELIGYQDGAATLNTFQGASRVFLAVALIGA